MQGPVYKEDHSVTYFNIAPEPRGFSDGILRKIRTIINKSEKTDIAKYEEKKYLLFTVTVNATNNFNGKSISDIQITSKYLIDYNQIEQVQINIACDLVERSIFNCYNLYIDKVSGTYLNNDTLSIPKSIKEDCIKQRLKAAMKN